MSKLNRNSNGYIFGYAILLTLVCGTLLAFVFEGLKEKQIYQILREKYGDWVIFDPQLNKNTYVLWLLPLLLFLFGGAIIYKKIISNKNNKI